MTSIRLSFILPQQTKSYPQTIIMHSFVFTTLTSLVAATAASPLNKLQTRATCHDVHFITARGSYQPMPDNQDNELVPLVCDNYSGGSCGYEDVQYPANPSGGADYCPKSEIPGANAAMDQVNAYASACPGTKIVLAGYSQGAEVIGDVLAGGGGNGCQPGYEPLDPNGTASAMSKLSKPIIARGLKLTMIS